MKITITLNNKNVRDLAPLASLLDVERIPEACREVINNHTESKFLRTDKGNEISLTVSDALVELVASKIIMIGSLMKTMVSMVMDFAQTVKLLDFGNTKHFKNGVLVHEFDSKGNDLLDKKEEDDSESHEKSEEDIIEPSKEIENELDSSKIEG